ncbi:MAG TPA: hypothetical protein VHN14_27930, partial [Kofleriaceae bacterium]|nr:hypothetical protein [Kofleriaceae bacterium]
GGSATLLRYAPRGIGGGCAVPVTWCVPPITCYAAVTRYHAGVALDLRLAERGLRRQTKCESPLRPTKKPIIALRPPRPQPCGPPPPDRHAPGSANAFPRAMFPWLPQAL